MIASANPRTSISSARTMYMSIWKNGKPLFAGNGYAGLSETALYFIGGVIKRAEDRDLFRETVRAAGLQVPTSQIVTSLDQVPRHVEILKDVCFRVAPITNLDATEMVRSIHGYRLLEGYRGSPAADIPAIEALLLRVARLVEEVPEISELDLNPVMALPPGRGCQIIDARIRVGP